MAVTNGNGLTVARSDVAAELVAAAIAQSAAAMPGSTPVIESARRLLLRHAHELCELHSLKPSEVLAGGTPDPNLRDVRGPMGLDHNNES